MELVTAMCAGQLQGGHVGSVELTFTPGRQIAGRFEADIGTAGSICLLLQCSLPCALFAPGPCELSLQGGTNADMAPQIDYLMLVLKPVLERCCGATFDCEIKQRGFFPRGGGHVLVRTSPVEQIHPIVMRDQGTVTAIRGVAVVCGYDEKMSKEITGTAARLLKEAFPGVPVNIEPETDTKAHGRGASIVLVRTREKDRGKRRGKFYVALSQYYICTVVF
jgi:RNA 3'-terminal phosphate cyclase (ATP)